MGNRVSKCHIWKADPILDVATLRKDDGHLAGVQFNLR